MSWFRRWDYSSRDSDAAVGFVVSDGVESRREEKGVRFESRPNNEISPSIPFYTTTEADINL